MLEYLPQLTKEDADWALHILSWDDETKIAFKIAKTMFEDLEDADYSE